MPKLALSLTEKKKDVYKRQVQNQFLRYELCDYEGIVEISYRQ